jgi:FAD/FMN-containing dehydrogenase/Fe-S oxidoreductase
MASLPVLNDAGRGDRDWIARGLAAAGVGEVRFGEHDRLLYATDASLYQEEPVGVVVPRSVEGAARAVRWCCEQGVAVLPRGGGTSLAGQATNGRAVVVDLSAWCRGIGELRRRAGPSGAGAPNGTDDGAEWEIDAEPGVVIDQLNQELARRGTGLFFAPDPATVAQATVGGCIGNNAAGARSIRYGRTSENLAGLDVLLSTGERVWLGPGAGLERAERAGETESCRTARRLGAGVIDVVKRHARLIRERFPRTIRRNAGYGLDLVLDQVERGATAETVDLSGLLCGSEGTLAVTLGARLRLHPLPRAKGLAVLSFASLEAAIAAVRPILDAGLPLGLSAVELLDDMVLDAARGNIEHRRYVETLPGADATKGEPKAVLYVEFLGFGGGDEPAARVAEGFAALKRLESVLGFTGAAYHADEGAMLSAWRLRRAGEPLLHGLPGRRKPVTFVEDNAVPVERLGEFVAQFKRIVSRHGTRAAYWAHASVGVLHVRPMIDLHDESDRARMRAIAVEVADLARSVGGVMSGEHGDGKVRGPLLERFFGPELLAAFAEVKRIFDPAGLLNPGNIVGAGPVESLTERLRVRPRGADVRVPDVETFFDYADQHGFEGAVEMCNGAGVCRRMTGGTMCPSYRATRDERHATRGRGNALRLAITGQGAGAGPGGGPAWNDAETIETLDLCLSCKACKSECPSNVDIARLKAEYTAQRYRGGARVPVAARVFGHVRILNRLGSLAPGLTNRVNSTAMARRLAERLLGVSARRAIPAFDRSLYSRWREVAGDTAGRRDQGGGRPGSAPTRRVALFADCFTAYNEPRIGVAAARVLRRLGCEVDLVPRGLAGQWGGCCGRALVSMGLLEEAADTANRTIGMLMAAADDPRVEAIVVCEPSCLSAMKDEWLQLKMPAPLEARRRIASKAVLVEEYVERLLAAGAAMPAPSLDRDVLLHGHCHQKALWGVEGSARLLRRLAGGRLRVLDSGCCGMAGSFGYEARKYDLSMAIGELSVFPPVRAAAPDAIIAAPGTSCRHQVRDGTGREAVHPIEVAAMVLEQRGGAHDTDARR